jgi:ribonuclease-3
MTSNEIEICNRIGHRFIRLELLRQALTHRSYSTDHNERLEFLGDSLVNCVVAFELYRKFPQLNEGELSRLRANLVNQSSLLAVAQKLNLGEFVALGEGERKSGGSQKPSILADTVEAIIGAIFLDSSFQNVCAVVGQLFESALNQVDPNVSAKDPKTLLQEYMQSKAMALPSYTLIATRGQAHAQTFIVKCSIESMQIFTEGEGVSRRAAEQEAANKAWLLAHS